MLDLYEIYPFYMEVCRAQYDHTPLDRLMGLVNFHNVFGLTIGEYIDTNYTGKSVGEIRDTVPELPNYTTIYFMEENEEGKHACWMMLIDKQDLAEWEARQKIFDRFKNIPFSTLFDEDQIIFD